VDHVHEVLTGEPPQDGSARANRTMLGTAGKPAIVPVFVRVRARARTCSPAATLPPTTEPNPPTRLSGAVDVMGRWPTNLNESPTIYARISMAVLGSS
jgi:hypothetical protein